MHDRSSLPTVHHLRRRRNARRFHAALCERCGYRGDDVRNVHADLWCEHDAFGCVLCARCDANERNAPEQHCADPFEEPLPLAAW